MARDGRKLAPKGSWSIRQTIGLVSFFSCPKKHKKSRSLMDNQKRLNMALKSEAHAMYPSLKRVRTASKRVRAGPLMIESLRNFPLKKAAA
jgi:hypothetical protein